MFLPISSLLNQLQRERGRRGLEDVQQGIRIPARFSAVQLQSLLASYCIACVAVCSNSQGYHQPHGSPCCMWRHHFSSSSLSFNLLSQYVVSVLSSVKMQVCFLCIFSSMRLNLVWISAHPARHAVTPPTRGFITPSWWRKACSDYDVWKKSVRRTFFVAVKLLQVDKNTLVST